MIFVNQSQSGVKENQSTIEALIKNTFFMIYTFTHGVTERCRSKHLSTCPTKIRMTIKGNCVFDSSISSTDYLTQLRLRLGRVNVSDETRKGKRKSLLFV